MQLALKENAFWNRNMLRPTPPGENRRTDFQARLGRLTKQRDDEAKIPTLIGLASECTQNFQVL